MMSAALQASKEDLLDAENVLEPKNINKQIKNAFKDNDKNASRDLHQRKMDEYAKMKSINMANPEDGNAEYQVSTESHKGEAGEFIKSIIFGGLDGIITIFAIVASVSGSDMKVETILVLGLAKLVGDGISMGVGDFLSEKAEIDFTKSELKRERWEFEHYKEGEIKEMIAIYQEKGISEEDATTIITTMAKYKEFFLEHMMMEELELDVSVIDDNPLKNGAITFLSFILFGTIPLLSYLVFHALDVGDGGIDWKLIIAIVLTCLTMFIMGAVKGKYCNNNMWTSGLFVMMNGSFAAGSAYLVSWLLTSAFGTTVHD